MDMCDLRHNELEKDMKEIKETLKAVHNQASVLSNVTIKNGGGRPVTYERRIFDQLLYDRVTLKGLSHKVIVGFGLILTILQIINLIAQFSRN